LALRKNGRSGRWRCSPKLECRCVLPGDGAGGKISQKSLTKTLRQLERGGLVTRVVFAEVPPRVEYRITKLGEELLAQLHPVWLWTVANVKRFEAARSKYAGDGRKNPWIKPRVPG